jgi:hypothetical protein
MFELGHGDIFATVLGRLVERRAAARAGPPKAMAAL